MIVRRGMGVMTDKDRGITGGRAGVGPSGGGDGPLVVVPAGANVRRLPPPQPPRPSPGYVNPRANIPPPPNMVPVPAGTPLTSSAGGPPVPPPGYVNPRSNVGPPTAANTVPLSPRLAQDSGVSATQFAQLQSAVQGLLNAPDPSAAIAALQQQVQGLASAVSSAANASDVATALNGLQKSIDTLSANVTDAFTQVQKQIAQAVALEVQGLARLPHGAKPSAKLQQQINAAIAQGNSVPGYADGTYGPQAVPPYRDDYPLQVRGTAARIRPGTTDDNSGTVVEDAHTVDSAGWTEN